MKKFEQLANFIEHQIHKGQLRPGDKLLSFREMSLKKGLSINTVQRAYELLEQKGFLNIRPQSGVYILNPYKEKLLKSTESKSIPLNIKTTELLEFVIETSKNEKYVQFSAAYLSPELYPSAHLNLITRQILREEPHTATTYELSPGSFEYRRQVSKLLSLSECKVSPDEILATNGCSEAISLTLKALCKPGDTVVVESPLFFGTLQALQGLNLKVLEIPSHPKEGIDLDLLKKALHKHKVAAAVFMPNFSNPLGALMSDTHKKELVRLMVRYGIPTIEDDIYAELPFYGERPLPLRAFDDSGLIITCSSFSKTLAPGLRVGWVACGRFYQQLHRTQLSTTMAAGSLSQKVLAQFINTKAYKRELQRLRLICSTSVNRTAQAVLNYFPEGTRVSSPQGGFVLWVKLPRKIQTLDLYRKALSKRVTFSPGQLFSATDQYKNFLRLNCGHIWEPKVENSLKTLGELAKRAEYSM